MNVVVVGDIGWRYLYHLGDEAMTEAAIDMLRARGISDITLVAGEPDVSEAFYGLPCVTRVGFRSRWTRRGMDGHLSRVADSLATEIKPGTIFAAIRDCDAVLIAGGGNMNSRDYHLLYERVATKRIAEHFGKPLYVTSQTVGPMLEPHDRELVVEIADYARAFGAREGVTAALLREHVRHPERVHHTFDDALMLTGDNAAYGAVSELSKGRPFVVASFTNHAGTIWAGEDEYYADIAALCRDIAETHDVDVLLAPHAGSLDPERTSRDQESNDVIASLAGTPRVRATRMITAREDVALIDRARLSLSTRYHPTVFAMALATPAIAIAPSYYSSVRMRGSMSNAGLQAFVLPTTSFHLVRQAIAEVLEPNTELREFLTRARAKSVSFQAQWWDALVASIENDAPVDFDATLSPEVFAPEGEWSYKNEALMPLFDAYAQTIDARNTLAREVNEGLEREERLSAQLTQTQQHLDRYKNRKVIRLLDRVGRSSSQS